MLVMASYIINKDMAWPSWELRKIDNHFVSSPSFTKLDFQNILCGLLPEVAPHLIETEPMAVSQATTRCSTTAKQICGSFNIFQSQFLV